jgi:hypothetical protein
VSALTWLGSVLEAAVGGAPDDSSQGCLRFESSQGRLRCRIAHFDPTTVSGRAARSVVNKGARVRNLAASGQAAQTAKALALTDLLVHRIRRQHNKPDFDLEQWPAALRRSQAASTATHKLEKQGSGIKLEKVRREYQKNHKKKLPQDAENVMLGKDKAAKATFQNLKTEATYNHIISIGYDGRTVSTMTQDPEELERIYTHLWYIAEEGDK